MEKVTLTAKRVERLLKLPGRYRDDGEAKGLLLVVVNERSASWQLRYERNGRERWLGLGSARLLTLKDARDRARAARLKLLDGIDPIDERRAARTAAAVEAAKTVTFASAAETYFDQHQRKWKNPKHRDQFISTLKEYAFPILGALPVAQVDTTLVLKVLEQPVAAERGYSAGRLWDARSETASRLRGRIETVLDWARVRGYRSGDNPARWRGHLDKLLPSRDRIAKTKHHEALPYAEVPALLTELAGRGGISARALEFTILTAARTGEVTGAREEEFDLVGRVWTIPAERMKAGREHRVPLSDRALAILKALPREAGNPFIFVGGQPGAPLSNMAMLKQLRGMRPGYTVHGFRSSFMDWAHENTGHSKVVIDMALAHTVGDKVEAAYRRGDLFAKRARLMADWARFCSTPTATAGKVVAMRAAE